VTTRQHSAVDANALLRLHDKAFVRHAYITLLGRQPDHEGLAYYTERIREGVRKERVLLELASSPEALPLPPGLEAMLGAERERERPGLLPRVARRLLSHAFEPLAARLRVVENLGWRALHERPESAHWSQMARTLDNIASRMNTGNTRQNGTRMPDHRLQEALKLAEMKRTLDAS
jgi:Domain of unknown function (DUF4214)